MTIAVVVIVNPISYILSPLSPPSLYPYIAYGPLIYIWKLNRIYPQIFRSEVLMNLNPQRSQDWPPFEPPLTETELGQLNLCVDIFKERTPQVLLDDSFFLRSPNPSVSFPFLIVTKRLYRTSTVGKTRFLTQTLGNPAVSSTPTTMQQPFRKNASESATQKWSHSDCPWDLQNDVPYSQKLIDAGKN